MPKPQTPHDYLSALPAAQREALENLRGTIQTAAPEAVEGMSSGVPAFRYKGKYLVSFGAAKGHVSLLVMRGAALKILEEELAEYDTSNTIIRFTPDVPLPAALVKKVVTLRMNEIDAQKEAQICKP